MTNTTNVPFTSTGTVCGRCTTGFGKDRIVRRHASPAAVKLCYFPPVAPAPVVKVPTPAELVPAPTAPVVSSAPKPKAYGRYSATCPKTGCKTHAVKSHYFTLKCSNHGKTVWTPAKQLVGTLSKSIKHKCDDRCMYAKGAVCVCACGGINHGLGLLVTMG